MAISLRVIWRFRLRSTLILLSATFGVAGVITSVSYSSGGRQQVFDQIRRLGTNVLVVSPQQSRAVGGRARTGSIATTLTEQDYTAIKRDIPSIVRSSALANRSLLLRQGDLSKSSQVVGCEPDYIRIKNWGVLEGSFFDSADDRRAARVVVLGHTVARDLFGDDSPIARRVLVDRVPFEVVGVMSERGQGLDVANEDNQVYVPLKTAMHRLMNVDYYSGLVFEVNDWNNINDAAVSLSGLLRQRHRASSTVPEDFQIQNQKSLIETQASSSETLSSMVRLIGLMGLIVSGLGILAISWIAVKERTVEIGTCRALGATSFNIFFQILFEALAVSLLGSATGLIVGWLVSKLISSQIGLPFVFNWANAASAFALSVALNMIFSLLPARNAGRLSPIAALKYE